MQYSKNPPIRVTPLFVKLGMHYFRPDHVIGLSKYKGSDQMTWVFLSSGTEVTVDVPLADAVKLIQEVS